MRPKVSALFTCCKRIKPYLTARRSALSRIPPTESMEVLASTASKLVTVSMLYKDSMESEGQWEK